MHCLRLYLTFIVFILILLHCCYYTWVSDKDISKTVDYIPIDVFNLRKEEDFYDQQNARILFAKEMEGYVLSARRDKTHWNNLDLVHMKMPEGLPHIRNPCWWSNRSQENTCPRFTLSKRTEKLPDTPKEEPVLRCLPHFYLIGQAKSGTTDIFSKITQHPDIVRPISKEPFWLMPLRFQKECSSLDAYLDQYQTVASRIRKQYRETNRSRLITGDGSTTTMSGNTWWSSLPGNEGCREPCTTNADILHHLHPAARIIVSLRNPTDRCYSYYIMKASILQYSPSQEHFHMLVENEIAEFNHCRKSSTLRACVFDTSQENYLTTAISLRSSIYHVYLLDWLRVFSREQIYVVHFESYTRHVTNTLSDIYRFLGVETLSEERLHTIAERHSKNARSPFLKQLGDMWPKTQLLLDTFFQPFNEQLSVILKDERFNWKNKTKK